MLTLIIMVCFGSRSIFESKKRVNLVKCLQYVIVLSDFVIGHLEIEVEAADHFLDNTLPSDQ